MSSPLSFSNKHFVFDIFVEAPELGTQEISNGGWEISRGVESMEYLIALFNRWGESISIEVEPVVTLGSKRESRVFPCFLDDVVEYLN